MINYTYTNTRMDTTSNTTSTTFTPNILCGIIKFSSRKIGNCRKAGYVAKPFNDITNTFPEFYVETKKVKERQDMFAVIEVRYIKNKMSGIVQRYIGYVNNTNNDIKDTEDTIDNYLNISGTAHWKKKFNHPKNYTKYLEDDNNERTEYIDAYTITYDGPGTKDFDDAISLKHIEDNRYEFAIHIADPTSVITANTPFDKELKNRCETLYTNNQSNMLPDDLMHQFSLIESEIRPALSLICTIKHDTIDNTISIINEKLIRTNIIVDQNKLYDDPSLNDYDDMTYDNLMNSVMPDNDKIIYYVSKHFGNDNNVEVVDFRTMIQSFMIHFNCYCYGMTNNDLTFTSPLRRYKDMIGHRLLNKDCVIVNYDNYIEYSDYNNYYHSYYKTLCRVQGYKNIYYCRYSESDEFVYEGIIMDFSSYNKMIVKLDDVFDTEMVSIVDEYIISQSKNLLEMNNETVTVNHVESLMTNNIESLTTDSTGNCITSTNEIKILSIGDKVKINIVPLHNRTNYPTMFFRFVHLIE